MAADAGNPVWARRGHGCQLLLQLYVYSEDYAGTTVGAAGKNKDAG